ncbi:MAG: metallophosphoesterase [Clostridia bacterium]|nr:metallophosphoesterase [Clostridia bacterium]
MNKGLKIFLGILLVLGLVFGGFAVANKMNEQAMNKYIDSFSKVEIADQLTPEYDKVGVAYFTTDENFKVMQLTDVHIGGGVLSVEKDKQAINAVAAMITAEKPDLVVVTGDISFAVPWSGTINNAYAHRYFIRLMENLGVYWTVTFGNHDSEVYDFYERAAVAKMYDDESLEYCLFTSDDGGVYGEGNHVINVKNGQGLVTKSLIMMDTNSYTDEDPLGIFWIYDNIHADQIEWYRAVVEYWSSYNSTLLASIPESERPENPESFTTVQSLLFIHIPLMEVRDAYNEYLAAGEVDTENVDYLEGKVGESDPYVYCSNDEEKMFETMLLLGSTKAMFYGHDHLNNIVLNYKGITLSYGYSIDYFAYSGIDKIGSQRGCTVINCAPDTEFEIIHENYYQDKYQPLYEKEVVDLTN